MGTTLSLTLNLEIVKGERFGKNIKILISTRNKNNLQLLGKNVFPDKK